MREGLRGAGSVETTAGEEWVGTAERHKSMPKTTCVKANRTLDAVSDGAFAATHHGLRVLSGFLLFSYTRCHRISSQCRS